MLENLRANKGGVITWAFLLAIIVVFIFSFGPGSFAKSGGCGAPSASYVARVNGDTISATEFERQYERRLQLLQAQLGGGFTRELAQQLGVANIALDDVVHRELLAQEALRRGVVVTDDEISQTVQASPEFQQGGRFDFETYRRSVAREYGSTGRFEDLLRRDLLAGKMQTLVAATVKLSEAEVRAAWQSEADRVELTFVRFPIAAAQNEVKVSDADVSAFAAANGKRIDDFHAANASRFDQPRKVHARHLLVRLAPDASDAQVAQAREKIDAAAARVKKGEDFAKVAAEVSEDANTKDRGGDLGLVTEALVEKPFADAAFALKAGEVSAPVRTESGFHLIQAVEVVPAKKVSKEEARPQIARELLTQDRAQALARERAQAALAAVQGGKSLADLFGAKKATLGGAPLAAEETGAFFASSPQVPKLGEAPALVHDAFLAKAGAVLPQVYATPTGPVVAVVKSRETADPAKFGEQRPAVEARLRNRKDTQVFTALLDQLRKDAKVEVNDVYFASISQQQQRRQGQ